MSSDLPPEAEQITELPPGVDIIEVTPEQMTQDLRHSFAVQLVEGTYTRLGPELYEGNEKETVETVRMACRDVLRAAREKDRTTWTAEEWAALKTQVAETQQADGKNGRVNALRIWRLMHKDPSSLRWEEWETLMNLIYPTQTKEEEIDIYEKNLLKSAEKGEILAIRKDEAIVGVIAVTDAGKWHDGRQSYEIRRAAVLRGHEGEGLYTLLAQEAERRIRTKNPNAPIKRGTKNPRVKASLSKKGYIEVPFDYGLQKATPEMLQKPGWKPKRDRNIDQRSTHAQLVADYRNGIASYNPIIVKRWIRDGYSIFYDDPLESTN